MNFCYDVRNLNLEYEDDYWITTSLAGSINEVIMDGFLEDNIRADRLLTSNRGSG
jgi:hypothetical protein